MNNYIKGLAEKIIRDNFNINISFNSEIYVEALIDKLKYDIREEINEYRKYKLISPQIYNLCYLCMCNETNIDKDKAKRILKMDVDESKRKMQQIDKLNCCFDDYQNLKRKYNDLKAEYDRLRKECIVYSNAKKSKSKIPIKHLEILSKLNETMTIDEIRSEIYNINYDIDVYLNLSNKENKGLTYEEYLLMLIYRSLGIDNQKYPDKFEISLLNISNAINHERLFIEYGELKKLYIVTKGSILECQTSMNDKLRECNKLIEKNNLGECKVLQKELIEAYKEYIKCPKCLGQGYINHYEYIEEGICFLCNGSGKLYK